MNDPGKSVFSGYLKFGSVPDSDHKERHTDRNKDREMERAGVRVRQGQSNYGADQLWNTLGLDTSFTTNCLWHLGKIINLSESPFIPL